MRVVYLLIIVMVLVATFAVAREELKSYEPEITLFESVEKVKQYLTTKAKSVFIISWTTSLSSSDMDHDNFELLFWTAENSLGKGVCND